MRQFPIHRHLDFFSDSQSSCIGQRMDNHVSGIKMFMSDFFYDSMWSVFHQKSTVSKMGLNLPWRKEVKWE